MPWLLKTEPSTYSYADLEKAKKATWDGVANALALQHMRAMKKGDALLIYHTGSERQIVGLAEVTKEAYPDPKSKDPKALVIDLKPKGKLKSPVTLDTIKSTPAFADWPLLKIGRLSIVPTPQPLHDLILQLATK